MFRTCNVVICVSNHMYFAKSADVMMGSYVERTNSEDWVKLISIYYLCPCHYDWLAQTTIEISSTIETNRTKCPTQGII